MAADELAAEARVATLRAERDRERAALANLEAALARVRAGAALRRWPRAFARGLAWGVLVGVVAGVAAAFRAMGC